MAALPKKVRPKIRPEGKLRAVNVVKAIVSKLLPKLLHPGLAGKGLVSPCRSAAPRCAAASGKSACGPVISTYFTGADVIGAVRRRITMSSEFLGGYADGRTYGGPEPGGNVLTFIIIPADLTDARETGLREIWGRLGALTRTMTNFWMN